MLEDEGEGSESDDDKDLSVFYISNEVHFTNPKMTRWVKAVGFFCCYILIVNLLSELFFIIRLFVFKLSEYS